MTKKKLPVRFTGQHFTIDKVLIKDAIRQANISNQDTVLDIGAGKGFLTVHLLKIANNVVAIENDTALVEHLRKLFSDARNVQVVGCNGFVTAQNFIRACLGLLRRLRPGEQDELRRGIARVKPGGKRVVFAVACKQGGAQIQADGCQRTGGQKKCPSIRFFPLPYDLFPFLWVHRKEKDKKDRKELEVKIQHGMRADGE